jgi:hypothetical protein
VKLYFQCSDRFKVALQASSTGNEVVLCSCDFQDGEPASRM